MTRKWLLFPLCVLTGSWLGQMNRPAGQPFEPLPVAAPVAAAPPVQVQPVQPLFTPGERAKVRRAVELAMASDQKPAEKPAPKPDPPKPASAAPAALPKPAVPRRIPFPLTVALPPTIQGDPGAFISVPATTDGKTVGWIVLDKGLNLFPVELLKDTRVAVVSTVAPGSYRIVAFTSLNDVLARSGECVVTVGQPVPPGPGPGPSPVPPGPTPPVPPAPGTFERAVWDAYQTDADPQKVAHAAWAASVYKAAPGILADSSVTTYGQLLTAITGALHNSSSGMPVGSIKSVLTVIAADEAAAFGTNGAALIDKDKAKAAFAKYAAALGNLK